MHNKSLSETMANFASGGRKESLLKCYCCIPCLHSQSQARLLTDPLLAPITKKLQIEFTQCEAKIKKKKAANNSFADSCADFGK